MKGTSLILRREEPKDYRFVEEITREAFWNQFAPGCDEHYLVHILRSSPSFINELDVVAELEGRVVGHIAYTKAQVLRDAGGTLEVLMFGPLSVLPDYQGQGIGGALIRETLRRGKELGFHGVLIYGDPAYYSRFGFVAAEHFRIGTREDMYMPGLQALELVSGGLAEMAGKFVEDDIFQIDAAAAKTFDDSFAPKERRDDLPSQARFLQIIGLARPR